MKRALLFAGALLCYGYAGATSFTTPSDSIKTKMEIKKMDFKDSGSKPIEKSAKKEIKPVKNELKVDKYEINNDITPISGKPSGIDNKGSVEEIKNTAIRSSKAPAKKVSRPAVSYPSYPGGNVAIRDFVRKNQQYPQECKRERLKGRVEVIIAIAPDGTPHSATISKSSGNVYMDAEALRIAELMPKWNPAPESDAPQSLEHVIFVNFRPGR